MLVTIVGAGYVGLSNAFLLALDGKNKVVVVDKNEDKIKKLKNGIMPINDTYIDEYKDKVNILYATDGALFYDKSDWIIIATNTDFDEETKKFNVGSIESVLNEISNSSNGVKKVLIKSTIPIGYTETLQQLYPNYRIYFSPEFLREGYALQDNLYPDRIVIGGGENPDTIEVAKLLSDSILKEDVSIIYTSNKEAEMIKLFANTYLAMRVAFVNEIDTFCQKLNLETANVLDAIGADHRIGTHYFNPSFGYGGYCLPKDSKQLYQEYKSNHVDSALMKAIIDSNQVRKSFIAKQIMEKNNLNGTIGIYLLVAKKGINNFRSAAIIDIIRELKVANMDVVIFDPFFQEKEFYGYEVIEDFGIFKEKADLIVANRIDESTKGLNVYTVDVYEEN